MKSPMVVANPYLLPSTPEVGKTNRYTDLQVLRSGAGWYIGTLYEEFDESGKRVWQEPGSRDSDYFSTEEGAAAYLKIITAGSEEDAALVLRSHP